MVFVHTFYRVILWMVTHVAVSLYLYNIGIPHMMNVWVAMIGISLGASLLSAYCVRNIDAFASKSKLMALFIDAGQWVIAIASPFIFLTVLPHPVARWVSYICFISIIIYTVTITQFSVIEMAKEQCGDFDPQHDPNANTQDHLDSFELDSEDNNSSAITSDNCRSTVNLELK